MFGDREVYISGAAGHELAPPSARQIEYYELRNISGLVSVTYLVGEEEFRKFASEQGWVLEPGSLGGNSHRAWFPQDWAEGSRSETRPPIEQCLFYEARRANGGGITVIYDMASSRAIINKSSR